MIQNTSEIKEKIISVLKERGPSLPIQISREVELSPLFASAFLSELFSETRIKISHLRVGNSPVYFVQGQEPLMEKFSDYLKSKEKEAFNLLRERKFLKDGEQQPAIRVALREIKDFAIPFRNQDGEIFWRYFTESEEDLNKEKSQQKSTIEIKDTSEKPAEKIKSKRKSVKSKAGQKQSEKFLERVREFLSNSGTEISNIENIGKNELVLKVKNSTSEIILVAYNKKKISEKEIIKASKKATEMGMKYSVISLGNLPKKIIDLMESLKNMENIEKIE